MPSQHNRPIPILYEDDLSVVFDKPSGLLVVPIDQNTQKTLVSIVNEHDQESMPGGGRLHPCHRLDRDTSGVILFARGKSNQQTLMRLFQQFKVEKKYVAFVQGRLREKHGEFRSAIKDFHQEHFASGSEGKWAVTRYQVLEEHRDFSVVGVFPKTGRTNQIRIHFAKAGHPLVGEDKYAFRRDFALRFRRTALHAAELQWPHPVHHRTIKVRAPLAPDMAEFLKNH